MTEPDAGSMSFNAVTSHGGASYGGLLDPTSVSVALSGFSYGEEAGWQWFERAVAHHVATVQSYARLLREAGGDVTDERVRVASTLLHQSVGALPIGHAAYAGVGFPSPTGETVRLMPSDVEEMPDVPRPDADRLHPNLDTAVRGTRLQRYELASQPSLPVEIELILARDPEQIVREAFVSNGTRSRSALLLVERDETDDDVRRALLGQRFASPEQKLDEKIVDLYWDSLEGVADLLGLSGDQRAGLIAARDGADPMSSFDDGASTVREVLSALGWSG